MNSKIYTIDEIKTIIAPIAKKYGIERAYLFGSYARGEATEKSDIDIIIDKGTLRGLFQLSGLKIDIEQAVKMRIDILTTGSASEEFREKIRKDEVIIYEQ